MERGTSINGFVVASHAGVDIQVIQVLNCNSCRLGQFFRETGITISRKMRVKTIDRDAPKIIALIAAYLYT
ncbi:hypothetical protein [Microbulbifer hainanensis]|uniref:hypothetical protein n=1 Tax=Microbulbifer hainanensis TaxID=2735675 RepID=UPI0018694390|nr:hypothetical protein [Microbulbifer hainanensis]